MLQREMGLERPEASLVAAVVEVKLLVLARLLAQEVAAELRPEQAQSLELVLAVVLRPTEAQRRAVVELARGESANRSGCSPFVGQCS